MSDQTARESLAKVFFSEPNHFLWHEIEADQLAPAVIEKLHPWVERLKIGNDPIILPYTTGEGTIWYVATTTSRAFRHVREELVALLGRTYSDFGGQPTLLDTTNPVEVALVNTFGPYVLRIQVPLVHKEAVWSRLELYAKLLNEAPKRSETLLRPAGRILADFEEALRRGDDTVANECIEELEHNNYLDARNLLYLRIRRDEGRQKWQEILDVAQRYHLISAKRRPRRVSQAILRAVYATTLSSYESAGDAVGALDCFRDMVYANFAPLFATRRAYQCSEADALFLMRAISDAKSPDDITETLNSIAEDRRRRPWFIALIECLTTDKQPTGSLPIEEMTPAQVLHSLGTTEVEAVPIAVTLIAARDAFYAGDLDLAWHLAEYLEPSEDTAQLIINCACDVGTLAAAQHALKAFMGLANVTRDKLERRHSIATNLERLRELTAPLQDITEDEGSQFQIPQNWVEWIEALSINQHWPEAASVAEQGSLDWDPNEFQQIDSITRIAEALLSLDTPGHARIVESFSYLLRSISRCEVLPRKLSPVLESLTMIHLLDEMQGRLFFDTLADLCSMSLNIGMTPHDYTNLLSECLKSITTRAGAADFDGLVELLDVLVTYSSPDTSLRTVIAGAITDLFVRFRSKAMSIQLILLRQLLHDAECEFPEVLTPVEEEDAEEDVNPLVPLTGKTIALYSLKESPLRRIARLLEDTVQDIGITTFHDKAGGSPALRSAARNADIFVIATAAAKHAATNFIEDERGPQAVTLKPDGQGSASMLRSLCDYAKSISEDAEIDR